MNQRVNTLRYLAVVVLLVFLAGNMDAQCAMCKQAAETSLKSDPNSMARSLNTGIIYLMTVPYLMILFIFRKQVVRLLKGWFGKGAKSTATPS